MPVLNTWELAKDAWNNRKAIYDGAVDLASRGIGAVADAAGQVADGARDVASRASQAVVTGTGSGWSKNMRPDLFSDIAEASRRHGVPESYMRTMAWIESKGDPNAKAKGSSASGIYQFIDSTAKRYGIQGQQFDQKMNVDAGARLALDNMKYLRRKLGRNPEPYELYLAHQQGMGGAVKLLTNPNAPAVSVVGMQAVVNNGGQANMTAGQFADKWRKSYEAAAKKAGVSMTAGERVDAVTGGAVSAVGAAAANVAEGAKTAATTASNAASSVADKVSSFGSSVANAVSNTVSSAADAAKGVYQQAVDKTSQAIETVATAFAAPWMDIAKSQLGVNEKDHDSRVREYHRVGSGLNAGGKTPWCASFVGWVLAKAGVNGTGSAAAASYNSSKYGTPLSISSNIPYGAVLHIKFKTGNHVAFCLKDLGDRVQVIGGNQSSKKGGDQRNGGEVTVSTIPKRSVVSATIPGKRGSAAISKTAVSQASSAAQTPAPANSGASGSTGGTGSPAAKPAAAAAAGAVVAPKPNVTPTSTSPQAIAISDAVPKTQMTEQQARQAMDTQSLKIMTAMAASMSSIDQKMTDLIAAVKNGNAGKSEPDAKTAPSKDTVEKPPSKAQTGRQMLEHVDAPINMLLS